LSQERPAEAAPNVSAARVFWALLLRDLRVVRREIVSFLVRTAMQPLLLVVVFGYLMPRMGLVQRGYTAALLPGVLAISLAFSSMQSVVLPMVADFGFTKEIEDRLLAPIPTQMVALEKVVSAVVQGVIAALFVLPVARLIMGPIEGLTLAHGGEILAVTLAGSAAFSAFGLFLGTALEGKHIGLMFSVIVAPMIMFGCAYYPWRGLDQVPAMKYAVLVNPLVYVSEGMRSALTPTLPHMNLALVLGALAAGTALFWWLGIRAFMKRALS
jgi:ABC-2 type transport system permease protein